MTSLFPCRRCHRRGDCPIETEARTRLRGSKITSAKIKCAIPQQDFPVGSVVSVQAFEIDPEYYNNSVIKRRGVVTRWLAGRATVILDKDQEIQKPDGDGAIGYLKNVESDRLALTGAPTLKLCDCGLSYDRCGERDFPSIRQGEWDCFSEKRERYP